MKKKVIKRAARKKKSKNNYFTMDTHDAIRKFQNEEKLAGQHEIYIKEILPAFNKLAENLIFIHKFAKSAESFERLKCDCVTFLYETIT